MYMYIYIYIYIHTQHRPRCRLVFALMHASPGRRKWPWFWNTAGVDPGIDPDVHLSARLPVSRVPLRSLLLLFPLVVQR